jgi:COMPASS component SWD1
MLISLHSMPPLIYNVRTNEKQSLVPNENDSNEAYQEAELIACWDISGDFIFIGTSKGLWQVFDSQTLEIAFSDRLASSSIRHFSFSRSGQHLSITVGDKSIRSYHLPYVTTPIGEKQELPSDSRPKFECVPLFKLQDLVNRNSWCSSAWSGNEELVIGATSGRSHAICIWSRSTGALLKLLDGPHEPLISFAVRFVFYSQRSILLHVQGGSDK